jgi:hypothetical protein
MWRHREFGGAWAVLDGGADGTGWGVELMWQEKLYRIIALHLSRARISSPTENMVGDEFHRFGVQHREFKATKSSHDEIADVALASGGGNNGGPIASLSVQSISLGRHDHTDVPWKPVERKR